jgi:hypothetical protein
MSIFTERFEQLVKAYLDADVEFPNLRDVTIAQWILESGYGRSRLAEEHLNFGGLKWRAEMAGFAEPVDYPAHDGVDQYCKFASVAAFIAGYWKFLDRAPYRGWRDHAATPESFIRFIGPIYTPTQLYADTVLSLLPKARAILTELAPAPDGEVHIPIGTAEVFTKPPIKEFIASPNCSSRNGERIRRVVMHYTTSRNVRGTIAWFQNTQSQVSAHYVIDLNGDIYQMVRDSDKAWHARKANTDSIGIEHCAAQGDRLTPAQEQSSAALLRWLLSEYKLEKSAITGHKYTPENIGHTDCPDHLFGDASEVALRAWVDAKV